MSVMSERDSIEGLLRNHLSQSDDEIRSLRLVLSEVARRLPEVRLKGYRPGDWLDVPDAIFFDLASLRKTVLEALE